MVIFIKKGISYIEIIISIVILSSLLFSFIKTFSVVIKQREAIVLHKEIFDDLSLTLDYFEAQIRIADELKITDLPNEVVLITTENETKHYFYFRTYGEYRVFYGGLSNRLSKFTENIEIKYDEALEILTVSIYNNLYNTLIRQIDVSNKKVI